ncbi:MAG: hypothetical protein ABIO39_01475 [Caulobacteraceae bacterium]
MKSRIAILAVVGALGISSAAAAQPWNSIRDREARLDTRIDRGIRDGSLTRGEAARLRGELRRLEFLEDRYRRDGLNFRERADLDRRFDTLAAQIRVERRDSQNRYGYGYGNGYR